MKLLSLVLATTIGISSACGASAKSTTHRNYAGNTKSIAHHTNPDKRQIALFGKKKEGEDKSEEDNKSDKEPKPEKEKEKDKEKVAAPVKPTAVAPPPITSLLPPPSNNAAAAQSDSSDPTQLDSALMSVLRDIDKSLRESDEVTKLTDPAQRAAMVAAITALNSALEKASIAPNRIVRTEAKDKLEKNLTAESWESGDLSLPNGSHASLNILWAKKVNGLVNVSITGNCNCKANQGGDKVGEWVVVLNGKSTLDSGFDIQSQSNVNFWLGKLNGFNIDATTCSDQVSTTSSYVPVLKALTTEKRRKFAEAANTGKKSTSAAAVAGGAVAAPVIAAVRPQLAVPPSSSARVVAPRRAVAGEYLTVSVVNADGQPESNVELAFNDFKARTNANGKVTFQVPEDAAPGPSLYVTFASRPEASAEPVYILQPLIRPSATDVPRIDRFEVNKETGILTIEGHNFDGIAENNHVILDARHEATIRFSSPVELQAKLSDLPPGSHDVIVQRNGIRSEQLPLSIPTQLSEAISTKTKKKN